MRLFKFITTIVVLVAVSSCSEVDVKAGDCDDAVLATVKDFTGLDGCGFVFELEDGTRLEPLRIFFCGTPPLPKEQMEDPLNGFEFIDGKEVMIGYEIKHEFASVCMVGPIVKITCITELSPSTSRE